MRIVDFGKTGYRVSRLGFGIMRLPTHPDQTVDFDLATSMIRHALDHGVNFLDTMHFYHQGQSEEAVGRAIAGYPRDQLVLQTKIGMYNEYKEKDCRKLLEEALRKMGTSHIDFYLSHSLTWDVYRQKERLFTRFTAKALREGLIRLIGFSSHDTPENIGRLIKTGVFSALTIQYNLLDRRNEQVLELAYKSGLGTVVMGPVAGGLLGDADGEILTLADRQTSSTAALALRFVMANPSVNVVLSGMSTLDQVKENLRVVAPDKPLSRAALRRLEALFEERRKLTALYCPACGYCQPCPRKINIPHVFRLYNLARVYGLTRKAAERYYRIPAAERASACTGCGRCVKKCPQKLSIPKRLAEIACFFESGAL